MSENQCTDHEWFRGWFSSPYYDVLYKHRGENEARGFINQLIGSGWMPKGQSVLDIACGNGRHSKYLYEMGLEVLGIDISPEKISEAQHGCPNGPQFVVADMRNFHFTSRFDVVVNLFTSFGYFENQEENAKVIRCIVEHLKPGGFFIIDYFNSQKVSASLPHEGFIDEGVIHISYQKYALEGMVVKDIEVQDGTSRFRYREKVQLLDFTDFSRLIEEAGMQLLHTFGNYSLEPFNPEESDRLILIARL